MNNNESDDNKLVKNISEQLKSSTDEIDAITAARLQAIRMTVMENAADSKPSYFSRNTWLLGSASTAIASLVIALIITINMNSETELNIMEDINLLSEKETLEFYENMDFYQWLEETQTHG